MIIVTAVLAALLFVTPSVAAGAVGAHRYSGEKVACSKLKTRYPDKTFLPGTSGYVYETRDRKLLRPDSRQMLTVYSLLVGNGVQHPLMRLCATGRPTGIFCSYYIHTHKIEVCCAGWRAYADSGV